MGGLLGIASATGASGAKVHDARGKTACDWSCWRRASVAVGEWVEFDGYMYHQSTKTGNNFYLGPPWYRLYRGES